MVTISTPQGDIQIELYDDTPAHKENFLKLIEEKFFNGCTFHRVIKNFMIQGGDPNTKPEATSRPGTGGPGYTIPAEINPKYNHHYGAVASARLPDQINPKRESSGSQFFIVNNKSGAHFLDGQYTVFGKVIEGMDVVDAISIVSTDTNDMPLNRIEMNITQNI